MDYRTYRIIRGYCRQDLRAYIDSPLNEDIHKRIRRKGGASAAIRDEQAAAMGLFQSEDKDLTPRERAAAHLLAVILNHRAIAWHREPVTPDGREPAAPLEPWQAAELWAQTRQAVTEYAAFVPEREAVALLRLIQDTAPAQQNTATPAPVEELNYSLLATPAQLLDAFGKWGMVAAWFDDLNSRQWLLEARRKKGQGQRGNVIEPLFCPFTVMNGLIKKVRKAKRLQPDTAWRTLQHKFPKVYDAFEEYDIRERTGD